MFKRISMLSVIFVTVLGVIFGLVSPVNASTSLPRYGPPVNVVQELLVHQAPEVYVVKSGDSLSTIARKLHLKSWEKFYCKNRKVIGNEPWLIQPKMRLMIKESKNICNIPVPVVKAPVAKVSTEVDRSPVRQVQTLSTTGTYLGSGSFQSCVIQRESGGNPTAYNPSSGASGLYGFLLSTWDSLGLGYPGGAYTAPVSVQNQGFQILYARDGTSPWAPYDGC